MPTCVKLLSIRYRKYDKQGCGLSGGMFHTVVTMMFRASVMMLPSLMTQSGLMKDISAGVLLCAYDNSRMAEWSCMVFVMCVVAFEANQNCTY
jgi:hypothetical protein